LFYGYETWYVTREDTETEGLRIRYWGEHFV